MTFNQKHENNNRTNHNNDYNNKSTEPGVSEEIWLKIGQAYLENVAPRITAAAAAVIEDGLKAFDADTVILAIEETGLAPRPSPAYLRAILRNWKEKGVTATSRRPWWKNPALQYQQRERQEFIFEPIENFINNSN